MRFIHHNHNIYVVKNILHKITRLLKLINNTLINNDFFFLGNWNIIARAKKPNIHKAKTRQSASSTKETSFVGSYKKD